MSCLEPNNPTNWPTRNEEQIGKWILIRPKARTQLRLRSWPISRPRPISRPKPKSKLRPRQDRDCDQDQYQDREPDKYHD